MGIFDRRLNYKPFEYPESLTFVDAINKAYWVHNEVDFTADIQDYHSYLNEVNREVHKRSILAIAQTEVIVKPFWGDLHRVFPKPELNGLGVTFAECHIDGTEVLTKKGWKKIEEITLNDTVASFDNDLNIIFHKPLNTISKKYSGILHKLTSKDHSAYITPGHRLAFYKNGREILEFEESKNISYNNSSLRFPVSSGVELDEMSYNDYITPIHKLRLAIQADGHKRHYRNSKGERLERGLSRNKIEYDLTFRKQSKIDRLEVILKSIDNLEYRINTTPKGVKTFTVYMDSDYDYKNLDWLFDESLDVNFCRGIVSELSYWDGSYLETKQNCKIKYYSTNKKCVDIIQMIGTIAGYKTNVITSVDNRSEKYSDTYAVSFNKNRETLPITSLTKSEIDYDGYVRCLTMPLGTLITRFENKTFWSGNCEFRHSEAYSRILTVNGYENEFITALENPIFKEYQESVREVMQNEDNTIIEKLLFFALVIEDSSLFSKFANVLSFTHFEGVMKNTANIIAWTATDEQIHANAGIYLINKIREEGHEMPTQEWINDKVQKYIESESKMLDWIFEKGELPYYTKQELLDYMKFRLDESIVKIGYKKVFDLTMPSKLKWFEEEVFSTALDDFFAKRPVDYTKHDKSISENDLF